MIPICLITGFLGSGKTTLLRRIVDKYGECTFVYLVNEFSAVDVDGQVLRRDVEDLVALPGGSIFCHCLVGEFIRVLETAPEQFGSPEDPITGVVIEASGVANPKVIRKMLEETGLNRIYRLDNIIAVVDPGTFPVLLQTLPNVTAQVESSHLVIVNKVDLFDEATIARTESEIRRINPGARLERTNFCAVDFDLFGGGVPQDLAGEYAKCADPNYATIAVRLNRDQDPARLVALLHELGDALYRAKGFVPAPGGTRYLDATPTAVTTELAPGQRGPYHLVVIVKGTALALANNLADRIKKGECEPENG
jgi:G3E family GTPase